MKKLLLFIINFCFVAAMGQNLIAPITISLPANPPANTADWATAMPPVMINAQTKMQNGQISPLVIESKILVTIKSGGSIICGSYNSQTAPQSNFNSVTKTWSGAAVLSLLGKDCILKPGTYELCVQFYALNPAQGGLLGEQCKSFTIADTKQQSFIPPVNLVPEDGKVLSKSDEKKPITFRWTPILPKPKDDVVYKVRIMEVLPGTSKAQAVKTNSPLFEKDVTNQTQLSCCGDGTSVIIWAFTGSNNYAWNVQAYVNNKLIGESEASLLSTTNEGKTENGSNAIIPITPTEAQPAESDRPKFVWDLKKSVEGVTYSIVLKQADEGKDPEKGITIFEKKNLTEKTLRYPDELRSLDTSKSYAWRVTATRNGMAIASSSFIPFWWWGCKCQLTAYSPLQYICSGPAVQLCAQAWMKGCGATGNYVWTLTNNQNASTQTGNVLPIWGGFFPQTICVTPNPQPTAQGTYIYTLKVVRGSCTKIVTFTLNVFDPVSFGGPTTLSPASICDGQTSQITVNGVTGGANIKWEFMDDCHPAWTPTTALPSSPYGIQGTPAGTNQQYPCICTGATWYTTRLFRAHVGSDDPNAPPCASGYTATGTLKIYCKPAINISVSPAGSICNQGTPVSFTLTATGVIGNVTWAPTAGFTITGTGPWTATGIPPTSGDIVFAVTASTGGPCPVASTSVTIKVDQPVTCPTGITTNRDFTVPPRTVCPPDDAELHIQNCQNIGVVEWAYSKTAGGPGGGPWTNFGGNGTWQNTNSGSLDIGIHTYYRATIHSVLGVCPDLVLYTDIDVYPSPTPPVVSPGGLLIVCEGQTTPVLTVAPPAGGFTYTWMHNGVAVSGPPTTWTATDAGNWWVVSSDQHNCGMTAISNIVKVKVDVTTVTVGPCCGTNPPTLFVVSANSSLSGNFVPSTGNVEWRVGSCNGTLVSNTTSVPNPIAGQTYCVRVRRNTSSCWSICKCFVTPKKCL